MIPGGMLQRFKALRRQSLERASTTDLLHELTSRLSSENDPSFSSEETLMLGKLLQDRLAELMDVHNNRFSHQRLRDYFQTYVRPYDSCRPPVAGATWVELGCGSQNPFGFMFLLLILGAEKCFAVDLDPVQDPAIAAKALADVAAIMLTDPQSICLNEQLDRVKILKRMESFDLSKLSCGDPSGIDSSRLVYSCQAAESLALPDAIADVVMSNSFLEHIPDVEAVVREISRITRPGGVGLHGVDWSDHRRYSDSQIDPLAFLRSSDSNPIVEGCNRMRPHEMVSVFERNGFQIIDMEVWAESGLTDEDVQKFVEPFRSMPKTQLQPLNGFIHVKRTGLVGEP